MRILIIGAAFMALTLRLGNADEPLTLVGSIELPGVEGRIDHLAFDAARQHLFVAALGNNTVEVVDTAKGAHLRSLRGFHEPQGIAVVADAGAIAIANGDTGTLQLVDAQTFATRWTVDVGGDADNVRYDARGRRIYVAAAGGLYSVDPGTGKKLGRISIDGHPESFQLETTGTRVFANLPGLLTSQIVAADRASMSVTARWSPQGSSGNYPMALDEPNHRVFVGCRRPARTLVFDTATGAQIASVDIVGDTDDVFYDAARRRVYVSGGDGYLDVVHDEGSNRFTRVAHLPTAPGARTSLYVPDQNRLYLAVPHRGNQKAEVRVYEAR
jgi:DNA-binding beta-propeller fold protein YncE